MPTASRYHREFEVLAPKSRKLEIGKKDVYPMDHWYLDQCPTDARDAIIQAVGKDGVKVHLGWHYVQTLEAGAYGNKDRQKCAEKLHNADHYYSVSSDGTMAMMFIGTGNTYGASLYVKNMAMVRKLFKVC